MTRNLAFLPLEILDLVLGQTSEKILYRLSQTCKRLQIVCRDRERWIKIIEKKTKSVNRKLAPQLLAMFPSPMIFYMAIVEPCSKYLGLWHKDYSFYMGGVVRIRFRSAKEFETRDLDPFVMIGESLVCPNPDDPEFDNVFSLNPEITIQSVKNTTLVSRYLFGIGINPTSKKLTIACLSKGLKFIHDASLDPMDSMQIAQQTGLFLDMSPKGIASRVHATKFPTGLPSPETGLWPFPPSHTLSSDWTLPITTTDEHDHQIIPVPPLRNTTFLEGPVLDLMHPLLMVPQIMSISCSQNCQCKRINSGALVEYNPKLSKIILQSPYTVPSPPPTSPVLPFEGVYMANYGVHGNELVLLRYSIDKSCFTLTKVTGDMHVPRGEESVVVYLDNPSTFLGYTTTTTTTTRRLDLRASSEFSDCVVYKSRARVAMEGYHRPGFCECDVIVKSRDQVVVYWYGLVAEESQSDVGWMSSYVRLDL